MQLLVWGASPQAAWLAARFHQLGFDTRWLTQESIASEIARFGQLHLVTPQRHTTVGGLPILTSPAQALQSPPAWLILAMPTWALAATLSEMAQYLLPHQWPSILTLQHGIGALDKIAAYYGEDRVIQGIWTRSFSWPSLENGQLAYETVVTDGVGGLALSQNPQAQKMAHMLFLAGLGTVPIYPKESLLWSDILWQIQSNALATLLDISPDQIYADPHLFDIEIAQLREAMQVIDRLNIRLVELPGVNVPRLGWQIRLLPKNTLRSVLAVNAKPPGLLDDLIQKTGRSDAAYLNGAVARFAHNLRLAAPVNHTLAMSVTDVAEGRALWNPFRSNSAYLETLIRIAARHTPA